MPSRIELCHNLRHNYCVWRSGISAAACGKITGKPDFPVSHAVAPWHSMARIVAGSPWTPERKSSNGVLSPRLSLSNTSTNRFPLLVHDLF
jgi:hypothetical protein